MHDHAGRVQHAAQARAGGGLELRERPLARGRPGRAPARISSRARSSAAARPRAPSGRGSAASRWSRSELVDRRKVAEPHSPMSVDPRQRLLCTRERLGSSPCALASRAGRRGRGRLRARRRLLGESRCPASRSATSSSTGRSQSTWTARPSGSKSLASWVTVDHAATERAHGRGAAATRSRTRVRALADPSPPRIWVTPVLEPHGRPSARRTTRGQLARPRGRRSSRARRQVRRRFRRSRARVDRAAFLRELKAAALAGGPHRARRSCRVSTS